jgi:3-methyladenine DNA glycosylase AlkD
MSTVDELKSDLRRLSNPERAKQCARYFKTGKGEYGEGDIFLGIIVPEQRKIAKKYLGLDLKDIGSSLASKIHEERLIALLILTYKFKSKILNDKGREEIFNLYLKNARLGNINNWDLVDLSAPNVVGGHLLDNNRSILYKLAKSNNLWERRIAVLATFMFIKYNDFKDALRIAELLLEDKHDLIHKAVGWMLREIGKRDQSKEEGFLEKHYKKMPRTMLRYAIERFEEGKRKAYLGGKI